MTDQHSSRRGAKSVLDSGVRLPMTAYQYLTFHPGSLGLQSLQVLLHLIPRDSEYMDTVGLHSRQV